MFDKTLILNKIRMYLNFKSDTDFAKYLGINRNVLSNWKARNTYDTNLLIEKCDFLNTDWLLTGNGPMLKSDIGKSENKEDYKLPVEQELELMKKLYALQSELMDEIKKERDRLRLLVEEKNNK